MTTKNILISDLKSQVGEAALTAFQKEGWKVLSLPEHIDKSNRKAVSEAIEMLETLHGPIDALLTAPEFRQPESPSFLETSIGQWNQLLDKWLRESINLCAAIGSAMTKRKAGVILVLTPDFSKLEGEYILEATAAGTLHGFVKSFGVEAAKDQVAVNGIYANLPYDLAAITKTAIYLIEEGMYISAQLVSLQGQEVSK